MRSSIVRLGRRDLVWINVTTNPTAEWIARQLTEAFPWDEAPRNLIRDLDRIDGGVVTRRMRAMGIRDKPIAPASPWQNGCAERLIGSIRRECVDHFIVLGEAHLRRILRTYARYYNSIRTHRSLKKMRRFLARFSEPELSVYYQSSAVSIITTYAFRILVHTTPEWEARQAHVADQLANFERHLWPAATTSRLPTPEQPKAGTMPTDNSLRLHDYQGIQNARHQPIEGSKNVGYLYL